MSDSSEAMTNETVEQWSKSKALTILAVAWAAVGLLTVVVLLGSVMISGLLSEGQTDGHRALIHMGIIGLAMIISILAVPHLLAAIIRTPRDGEDYESIDITPLSVSLPGVLLPTAICFVGGWLQDGTDLRFTTMMAMVMMLSYRYVAINEQLGPLFKSRAPELWAEALDRHARQKVREGKAINVMGPVLAAVFVIIPVLIIIAIVAKAIFGN